jgi:hypothetical protein
VSPDLGRPPEPHKGGAGWVKRKIFLFQMVIR